MLHADLQKCSEEAGRRKWKLENLLKRFLANDDGDVTYVIDHGIAYQTDMTRRIKYDAKYLEGLKGYRKNMERLEAVNRIRVDLVNKFCGESEKVLDYGVGACDFIDRRKNTYGFDISQDGKRELISRGLFSDSVNTFSAVCVWDVLEHMDRPDVFLHNIRDKAHLFVSIPVIEDMKKLKQWPHYKPGEHLYYFTEEGFLHFMQINGFRCIYSCRDEVKAGRVDILTAVFVKDLPGYRDMIGMYAQMHEKRYGISADDHRDQILKSVVKSGARSILDYGCGQAGFSKWFWNDGKRKVAQYDPAIPAFKEMPEGAFDLVLCCDVMEHIEMRFVPNVLDEIRGKANNAVFTIATKLARARLPDGRNAHVTILRPEEWRLWIEELFGYAEMEPTVHPRTVLIRTFPA